MEANSKSLLPPYRGAEEVLEDVLKPTTLVLVGQSVMSEAATARPLYQMNWSVTSIPQKSSSVVFERVEDSTVLGVEGGISVKQSNEHLFYLAHPAGTQYQTDTPAYYLTSVSPETLGNICLEVSRSRFQKPEFKALLNPKKRWSDTPLFDRNSQLLFDVKPKWMGGRYTWTDPSGAQIAYEDAKDDQHKLIITESIQREMRDALVATWCLRLWHDTAESRQAKRDAMERMTPPDAVQGYGNMKMAKRVGALGALGGAGA
ncbi:hypothetical protein F4677DRAFT_464560 [Hypoxylon crocopeplum]|nr:hypothetical protein F4677DRAFT_464560 [Hypoxylon crocopeplum]